MTVKEEKAGLLKLAKVTPATATATALTKVPGGKVQSAEIEKEDGKLVYSFDIKVAGKSGIEEVLVDALTGAVVGVEHETPADEAKEAKEDKAKAAKAKVPPAVKKPGA
ncbi:PepSY domain-containing protein [Gemmatimonas groenlandica]|uniref:PepSY domain-containing protein n=1 Tax=Gemmatimonas groenlandica TaxID=2732249 RepID=UPI00197E30FC|nr:PepSY domain-containing protein [Gemmatimonas groenlandica]